MSKLIEESQYTQNKTNTSDVKFLRDDQIKKRKDPKTMSIEELEQYLSRNKHQKEKDDNKSLNSSFNSQKHVNYSFTETNKIFNKLSENKFNNDKSNEKNNNTKGNETGNTSQIIKPIFSNEILSSIALKNPFIQQDETPTMQNKSQIKNTNTNNILGELYSPRDNNTSNISYEQNNYSDNEENRRYKFNPKSLLQNLNNNNSSNINNNSNVNNCIISNSNKNENSSACK